MARTILETVMRNWQRRRKAFSRTGRIGSPPGGERNDYDPGVAGRTADRLVPEITREVLKTLRKPRKESTEPPSSAAPRAGDTEKSVSSAPPPPPEREPEPGSGEARPVEARPVETRVEFDSKGIEERLGKILEAMVDLGEGVERVAERLAALASSVDRLQAVPVGGGGGERFASPGGGTTGDSAPQNRTPQEEKKVPVGDIAGMIDHLANYYNQ